MTTGIRFLPPFSPAAAHEGSELPVAALQQTHLIAASSHAEQQESREWLYYPPGGADAASGHGAPAGSEEGRVGPVSKAEIRQLYRWAHSRGTSATTQAPIRVKEWCCWASREAPAWRASGCAAQYRAPKRVFLLPLPPCLRSSGAISAATPFWAAGMPEPLPLAAVRELRWWVARKQGAAVAGARYCTDSVSVRLRSPALVRPAQPRQL